MSHARAHTHTHTHARALAAQEERVCALARTRGLVPGVPHAPWVHTVSVERPPRVPASITEYFRRVMVRKRGGVEAYVTFAWPSQPHLAHPLCEPADKWEVEVGARARARRRALARALTHAHATHRSARALGSRPWRPRGLCRGGTR